MFISMRVIILLLSLVMLNACANRTHTGAVLGAGTSTAICAETLSIENPYVIALCATAGAFKGADIMYQSDYDVHNAVFVDHLNNGTSNSYTNWYNQKTGNSGIIKVTRSYTQGPIKCKDYDATIDITQSWPLIGIGGVNREVVFGTACQMPDGQWVEKQ